MIKQLIALAVLTLAAFSASATVTYEWVNLTPLPDYETAKHGPFAPLSGRIEISDAAWRSGSLQACHPSGCECFCPNCELNPSGFLSFAFATVFINGQHEPTDENPFSQDGWYLDLDFSHPVFLRGSMWMNCSACDATVGMAGKNVWTISEYAGTTDPNYMCHLGSHNDCDGGTGMWRRTNVPEPGTLALLGLGLLGVIAPRRKKALSA